MTIAQFLEEVEKCRAENCPGHLLDKGAVFYLDEKWIRSEEEECPINEIAWRLDIDGEDVLERGEKLGLRERDVRAIASAADGRTGALRKRLLKACGLSNKSEKGE